MSVVLTRWGHTVQDLNFICANSAFNYLQALGKKAELSKKTTRCLHAENAID